MQKYIYTTLICGVLFCTGACRKYVEIAPVNTRVLEKTADYQSLMYNTTTFDRSYYAPAFAGDDMGTDDIRWQNGQNLTAGNMYTWSDKIYAATDEDADWNNLYQQLYICNTIVSDVMTSKGGTEQQKQGVLSAALVHRAFIYFTLVNLYGKQYDAATAASDPGVPLVLEPRFFTDLTRGSVQKVYDQIKADLNRALPGLPDLPDFNSNPSKAAAYGIMARVCLHTREFAEAERNANLALALKNTLIDLRTYANSVVGFPTRNLNPEEIFLKKLSQVPLSFPMSADAISMFSTTDLRYQLFTVDGISLYSPTFNNRAFTRNLVGNEGSFTGPNVPEMMLIKAECEARAGNAGVAVDILNNLRTKRFRTADYVALTATDANDALRKVIDERKREFLGRGFRWFDQRRLSKDAGFVSTVTRSYRGVTYTLEPGSNRYVFPIGDKYILLNPEIIQNPR